MAEVLNLFTSVTFLIPLTSKTSKTYNKLTKNINFFVNIPIHAQKVSTKLIDLAQVLELFQSFRQPLDDGGAGEDAHVDFIERSLTRVRTDVQEIG